MRNVRASGGRVPEQTCRYRKQANKKWVATSRDNHLGLFLVWGHELGGRGT